MLLTIGDSSPIVGIKQVTRAVESGKITRVFVALDAEHKITAPLEALCHEKNVAVEHVDSMKALGQACGIAVGASAAGIKNKL